MKAFDQLVHSCAYLCWNCHNRYNTMLNPVYAEDPQVNNIKGAEDTFCHKNVGPLARFATHVHRSGS